MLLPVTVDADFVEVSMSRRLGSGANTKLTKTIYSNGMIIIKNSEFDIKKMGGGGVG